MTGESAPDGRPDDFDDGDREQNTAAPTALERIGPSAESGWARPDADPGRYFHRFTAPMPIESIDPPMRMEGGEVTTGISFLPLPPVDAPAGRVGRSVSAAVRLAMAHSPLVVLLVAVGLVGFGAVSPDVGGVEVFLPPALLEIAGELAAAAVVWLVLAFLLGRLFASGSDHPDAASAASQAVRMLWPFVFYAGLFALGTGAGLSVYLVATNPPESLEPNVVYASGFLLLLYVGGPLVYDGLVRTEQLFERLHLTGIVSDDHHRQYRQFREELTGTLNSHVAGIPTALLIAIVFVAQFVVLWVEGAGPFVLDTVPTLAFVVAVDVVIVVVTVQFLVLVKYLNELLDEEDGADVRLVYRPAHEDGVGGFHGLGRFATRVNTLLLLAGGYLVYRLHVQGFRDPLSPFGIEATVPGTFLWTLSYALPVAVYAVVMAVWLYFSFWQIHRKMVREKAQYIREQTTTRMRASPDDLERWGAYNDAPEWPVRYRLLVTILSLDILSVLLGVVALL